VLRIGLTGGTGSGKSTAAARLSERGAVVVDADRLAREVVAPGTPGLAAVVAEFGPDVLTSAGELDRAALAAAAFASDERRRALESITHPRIAARTAELAAAAPPDAVLVHDVPLLVEKRMAPGYHLVVVVDAPVEERVRRLVGRGLDEADARRRIAAQADDEARRRAADVWLDNVGSPDELREAVDVLWEHRFGPFRDNLVAGRPATPAVGAAAGARDAEQLLARVVAALGALREGVRSSASVVADVVQVELVLSTGGRAADVVRRLAPVGFVPVPGPDGERRLGGCDPGRAALVVVRA